MTNAYWPPAIVEIPIEEKVEKLENIVNILNFLNFQEEEEIEYGSFEIQPATEGASY